MTDWLGKMANLKVYRARHGPAPHKPLLLLVLLELAERGELSCEPLDLTAELSFRFDSYARVVVHRRPQRPNVRYPFHHLGGDGFLTPLTETGDMSRERSLTCRARLDPDFVAALNDPEFRQRARRILIAKYFEPAERNALYHLVGMPIPKDDEIARDASFEVPKDAQKTGRELRFRLDVVAAYNYTCALTGYRVTTIGGASIVDAAHIHAFKDSRNNDPRNGIALCKNAHWLFDAGLWSIDDDYRVIIAKDYFAECSPDQKPLTDYHGQRIRLPANQGIWPDPRHLAWHRKQRFRIGIR